MRDCMPEAFCCRRKMDVTMDLGRFTEMHCGKCGDVIYVKNVALLAIA